MFNEIQSDLPKFFQFQGQSISDGLLEFEEIGGTLEEDFDTKLEENEEVQVDDETFGEESKSLRLLNDDLPDFFKPKVYGAEFDFDNVNVPSLNSNNSIEDKSVATASLLSLLGVKNNNSNKSEIQTSSWNVISEQLLSNSSRLNTVVKSSDEIFNFASLSVSETFPTNFPPHYQLNNQFNSNFDFNDNILQSSMPPPPPPHSFMSSHAIPGPFHSSVPHQSQPSFPAPPIMMQQPQPPPRGWDRDMHTGPIPQYSGPGVAGAGGWNRPPPPPGPPPAAVMNAGNRQGYVPRGPPSNYVHGLKLRTGTKMGYSEVSFVVRKVLEPTQTVDPFADDYYNLQFKIKKNDNMRDEAVHTGSPLPAMLFIPLPTWKDTKDRIRQQIENTNNAHSQRTKDWEEKQQVLGHNVKSNVARPREVLSMPSLSELMSEENSNDNGISRVPYSSRLWNMRQAVQKGYEALYTVQELQYLLHTPVVVANNLSRDEIIREIDKAISILAQSLGIRVITHLPHQSSASADASDGQHDPEESLTATAAVAPPHHEISLEGGLVAAILQTAKGKRLLSRSFQLLSPDHRWALIPAILARILQVNPSDQQEEDKQVENKLIATLIGFIHHTHQYQKELQQREEMEMRSFAAAAWPPAQPIASMRFATEFLGNLRQSIKSVMVSFMDKAQLRQALLSSRSRAEVIHIIVQMGDKVCETLVEESLAQEWIRLREAFMSMLDN